MGELLRQIQKAGAEMDACLDHRALKPFIKRRDSDPLRPARHCSVPGGPIGSPVVAGYAVRMGPARNTPVIVTRLNPRRPDLCRSMRALVGVDAGPETPIYARHRSI